MWRVLVFATVPPADIAETLALAESVFEGADRQHPAPAARRLPG
jgi:hypothetical protein